MGRAEPKGDRKMSRTDKTAPHRVKVHNRPNWLVEQHNHENGVCDLPPRPKIGEEIGWDGKGACHWWYAHDFWMHGENNCPCPMCRMCLWSSDHRDPKVQRREGRRLARDWWREME